ncbi:LOW QUALITY PROTEIN: uncharacterized protein LOC127905521 [Populus trichocarpa]|uniref:LOW QUALITY PROTEIN: uncharacterized protein LOC127905521 n=1 Tax=Populus trichocarpa TaxID=3694 RepID=UPI002278E524|nr:LOW QUALITY PROTEIN: uncharacterized protein LOC127905521 [Populus trichocarpa]
MDIAGRLATIQQEIGQVENEKLQREQMLGLFWEHMPAIDPSLIRGRMLAIQNQIQALENRKRALLLEQQELLVQAATRDPPKD